MFCTFFGVEEAKSVIWKKKNLFISNLCIKIQVRVAHYKNSLDIVSYRILNNNVKNIIQQNK